MTEKEWQQIKRLDISFVVIGGVGTLLITAMIVALSYLGWFDQFTDSGLLSSLDEWLVTVLIGGILLVPFLIVTVIGILLVRSDLRIERERRKKPPEPPDEFPSLYEWLNSKAAGKDPYTEIMFPEHDIHFIAVNDGVDSTQGDNEFTPFRNIINEWYAKDTSKKIRAVMKVKGNAGEHLTTLPPYGYMKAPDNKKLWVRDEEAAAVVYEIGLYVMDGFGPSQIARKLTERRILTPAAYYASRGRKASNIKRGLPYAWDASTVADIMDRWREYLGHTVNFNTRKKSYKSKKVIHNPESEWLIFENTHDPIWTEAIADAARAARQTRRRPTKMGEMGMFSGMMFCADCGSVMYQCRATNFRREQECYLCAGYRKSRDFCGQTHSIRTVILEELILENLREIVSFASRSKDEFVRLVMDSDLRQRDRDLAKWKRQLVDSEKRITELDAIFKRLYEDNISGKLSDERFQKLSADYEKEEQELKVLASSLRKEVELEESKSADVDRFLSVVERYTDIPELTPCILHEFVEKIIVHAASDPKGKNRTQEIDIYYKGIGALEMSKVTASTEK